MRTTGSWNGEYTYGPDYSEGAGESVPFRLSLTESWLGRLSGYVRDDASRGGVPERGRVRGRRGGSRVEFVKSMPVSYTSDGGGLIETRLFLAERLGVELPDDLPPQRITYTGRISADGESMAGEWRVLPWPDEETAREIGFVEGTGTWSATKVSGELSAV